MRELIKDYEVLGILAENDKLEISGRSYLQKSNNRLARTYTSTFGYSEPKAEIIV